MIHDHGSYWMRCRDITLEVLTCNIGNATVELIDELYNELMLIKCIEKHSLQGYALLTVGNHKDGLVIPELSDSCH